MKKLTKQSIYYRRAAIDLLRLKIKEAELAKNKTLTPLQLGTLCARIAAYHIRLRQYHESIQPLDPAYREKGRKFPSLAGLSDKTLLEAVRDELVSISEQLSENRSTPEANSHFVSVVGLVNVITDHLGFKLDIMEVL